MMSRKEKILSAIDPASQSGIEIGALMNPIVTRKMGDIAYVDHASTSDLREWYRNDPNVNIEKIVDVNYVWGESSLEEAVGAGKKFDYVIASHVIEHVPDMITWLSEISTILKTGGILSLVVPDKRYTFDRLRRETVPADLVEAYTRRLRKPSSKQIFDHFSMVVEADAQKIWDGEVEEHEFKKMFTEQAALNACRDAIENEKYIDSHCWVFTPFSFFENLKTLIHLDLFDFELVEFRDTERGQIEFFATLRKLDDALPQAERQARALATLPILPAPQSPEILQVKVQQQEKLIAELMRSRGWRFTAPIRDAWARLDKRLRRAALNRVRSLRRRRSAPWS